jgi:hypothetical protein
LYSTKPYSVVFHLLGQLKGVCLHILITRGVGVEGILCLLLNSGREKLCLTYRCKNPPHY